jgi:hypothetical protein
VLDVAFVLTSDHTDLRGAVAVLGLIIGWGFIGTGLFTWARRPDNALGTLMVGTGFAWFVGGLSSSNIPAIFSIGSLLGSVYVVTTIHTLLAAPQGTVSAGDRRILTAAYFLVTVGIVPLYLFYDPSHDCSGCPDNVFMLTDSQTLTDILSTAVNLVAVVLLGLVLRSLVRRWRAATPAERRLSTPMYAAGVALMLVLIAQLLLQSASGDSDAVAVAFVLSLVPFSLVPFLFLGSLVRARLLQGGAVAGLMRRLNETPRAGGLRDALADALEDPSLELVYWIPERESYVDFRGRDY